jgi:acetyltransferase-like isoleucine patch superfamily enzyme
VHEDAWIGEAALVVADVGPGAMVTAGAVVSTPVRGGIVVAGNPARFVRDLHLEGDRAAVIA